MMIHFDLCTSYSALLLMYLKEANLACTSTAYRFTHIDEFTKATVYPNTVFNSVKFTPKYPKATS